MPGTWVMLPTYSIKHDRVLRRFLPGDLGCSVAALKLYLVIAGHVANPRWGKDDEASLSLSYSQLSEWASVSRSMIGPALGRLGSLVDVESGQGRATNRYRLCGYPIPKGVGWAKLPIGYLLESSNALDVLSARSRIALAALKLYILLITFRDNASGESRLSYDRIQDYSAVARTDITKAISTLVSLDLVAVRSGRDGFLGEVELGHGHNVYRVHGLRSIAANAASPRGWRGVD